MVADGLIVVAGEALIDLVPEPGDVLAAHPGGGPFNTARALGRLERPVAFLGRLSSDRFGAQMAALLAADRVRPDALVPTDDPTTLALAELDDDGVAVYTFWTEGTSAPGLTETDADDRMPDSVGFLHVGTLGMVLEPIATTLETLVGRLAGRALVMLDPNCRPAVIGDRDVYRERLRGVLAGTDVLKVSEEDVCWLLPGLDPVAGARELLADGPAVVLLTRGSAGALVMTASDEIAVPAPRVTVVDTIGAGDAFSGGWLTWWSEQELGRDELDRRDALVEATSFACLVAARTCERAGASPPFRHELPLRAG